MSEEQGRVNTELIIKLFDTLKESNNDIKRDVGKQTEAIFHLSSLIKEGVTLEDIKRIIEDHHTHSGEHLDNIDTCTESIDTNSVKILEVLESVLKKTNTMIIVVLVTFALMAISYLFVSNSVETMIKDKVDSIEIEEKVTYGHSHKELLEEIEKIRKDIEDLH